MKLYLKIPASTLIETLVALTIIMFSVSMAILVYTGVMNSSKLPQQLMALTESYEPMSVNDTVAEQDTTGPFRVSRSLVPFKDNKKGLKTLIIEGFDQSGKKSLSVRKIVIDEP